MDVYEKSLNLHKEWKGKLDIQAKCPVKTAEDLSLAYTPGVAEPCREIAKDPDLAYTYTGKANTIAVVSDGSAVSGLERSSSSNEFESFSPSAVLSVCSGERKPPG